MLTITIAGETPEDVKNQLIAFDKALTPPGKTGKATEMKESEEKPGKKKSQSEETGEKVLTHEDARAAIIKLSEKLEWDPKPPKINAFTKKFAKRYDLTDDNGDLIERIPQIPVKKLKAFMEAIEEEGEI